MTRSQEGLEAAYYSQANTDMRNHWYPLITSATLKTGEPLGQHILDDPVVLYRDPTTSLPLAFADKCAHRSAPLSVGRIMDGKLECRYHGWQFGSDGVCSKVPSNPKVPGNAKLRKYPTAEVDGFVWIWPGDLDAVEKVPSPSIYFATKRDWVQRGGCETLDIDSSLLNENFLDPSHLPFTHDTTIGKRENATHMAITREFIDQTAEGHGIGIEGLVSQPNRPDLEKTQQKFQFLPPCIVALDFGTIGDQTFYSVPTKKGHCNFVYVQRFSFLQGAEKYFLGRWLLDWYNPSYVRKILMEDYAMLKGQQERLAAGANAMNSPVAADLLIKTYRNWWRKVMKREDGGPWFKGYSTDMEDILLENVARRGVGVAKGTVVKSAKEKEEVIHMSTSEDATLMKRSQEDLEEAYYSEANTNMRDHWYPLILGNTLKAQTPDRYYILGDPIVLYRDPATKSPIAFADKCPHRSAPLSTGRIMDGKLECRYHGWQFDTNGSCTKVPSNKKIPANAKVRKYPTVESEGFIWIWPGDLDAMTKSPKPAIYFPKVKKDWIPRIGCEVLDIDSSLLNENFLDPAHIPFTHDKTIGKRSNATTLSINCNFIDKTAEGLGIGIEGLANQPERPDLMKIQQKFQFLTPCIVSLDFGDLGDQTFYSVPTKKGHCHFIYIQRFSFLQGLEKNFLGRWILDWYNPSYTRKILMEDYEMLKGQQERLAAGANAMNSPVVADLMIKTYRNWWRKVMKREGGMPWFAGYSTDMEDIFLEDGRGGKANTEGGGRGRVVKRNKEAAGGKVEPE
ncbi:hypothetical protein HDU98_008105 [Podochytrium sp. JEL0797]|nr:hypothetical protein HDU98_008105 [Podochytrium sp. JEL0797]